MSPFDRPGRFVSDDDYYIILGVDFYATQETIAHAYRQLAKKYHPDKHNRDERSRKEARAIFERIRRAYDVLGDPSKRKIYDTLGSDGLKRLEWQLTAKPMTDWEIRTEYERIQKLQEEKKISIFAKPRAWLTVTIDASSLFKLIEVSDDIDEDDLDAASLAFRLSNIEISSMSASITGETALSTSQTLTFNGDVNDKNGVGEKSLYSQYVYKYSPTTQFNFLCRVGTGPVVIVGVEHELNEKTSVNCKGIVAFTSYDLVPSAKITLTHKIRDYLVGKITYSENLKTSMSTSLIYYNKRLAFEVITSYKLSSSGLVTSVGIARTFNSNQSKVHVTMGLSNPEGVTVAYGCDTRVFEINAIGAALVLGMQSGVTLKLRYERGGHQFSIPIYLSDDVHSSPVFYGTMVPLVSYFILDRFWFRHHKKSV